MNEILKKPYSFVFLQNEDGVISGEISEFPGCYAQGDTIAEAMENLVSAADSWIEASLEQGLPIPEPYVALEYGGKVALRLPKSLHKRAVRLAEVDGVSLNQFIVEAIAEKVGAENFFLHLVDAFCERIASTSFTRISNLSFATTEKIGTYQRSYFLTQPDFIFNEIGLRS